MKHLSTNRMTHGMLNRRQQRLHPLTRSWKQGTEDMTQRHLCSVFKSLGDARRVVEANNQSNIILKDISATLTDQTFLHEMKESISISGITRIKCGDGITAKTLAHNWGIGIEMAKRTLNTTTQ